jgi:sugar phosphate isomerase/epimerase
MRLGGSVMGPYAGPEAFVAMARECGFWAVTFPLDHTAATADIDRLVQALRDADIVIAEVGAWNNNALSPDITQKVMAINNCKKQLELAEYVGARCCVNVAGGHGTRWDGPSPDSFSDAVFNEVVESVRDIIDGVKPSRTCYSLEPMPWMLPDSADAYLRLLDAVDRSAFAVHLDVVNLVNSPSRYYANSALTQECFDKLGARTKSIHIKDIVLSTRLTVHLDECLVGEGGFDLACLLRNAATLDPDMPVLVEHINNQYDYRQSISTLNKMLADLRLS